jgi:hypothetical protein
MSEFSHHVMAQCASHQPQTSSTFDVHLQPQDSRASLRQGGKGWSSIAAVSDLTLGHTGPLALPFVKTLLQVSTKARQISPGPCTGDSAVNEQRSSDRAQQQTKYVALRRTIFSGAPLSLQQLMLWRRQTTPVCAKEARLVRQLGGSP